MEERWGGTEGRQGFGGGQGGRRGRGTEGRRGGPRGVGRMEGHGEDGRMDGRHREDGGEVA